MQSEIQQMVKLQTIDFICKADRKRKKHLPIECLQGTIIIYSVSLMAHFVCSWQLVQKHMIFKIFFFWSAIFSHSLDKPTKPTLNRRYFNKTEFPNLLFALISIFWMIQESAVILYTSICTAQGTQLLQSHVCSIKDLFRYGRNTPPHTIF